MGNRGGEILFLYWWQHFVKAGVATSWQCLPPPGGQRNLAAGCFEGGKVWEERKREQWPRKDGWRQWEEEGGRRWKLRVGSSSAPTAFHARRALPTSHLLACLPTLGDLLLFLLYLG